MKIIALVVSVALTCSATAGPTVQEPLHAAEKILNAVYEKAKVDPQEVSVTVFEYDYLKGEWHVELAPLGSPCIDCYPAFYIDNEEPITVRTVMHG